MSGGKVTSLEIIEEEVPLIIAAEKGVWNGVRHSEFLGKTRAERERRYESDSEGSPLTFRLLALVSVFALCALGIAATGPKFRSHINLSVAPLESSNTAKSLSAATSRRRAGDASSATQASQLETVHIVPEGGGFSLECLDGSYVSEVVFASYGLPTKLSNGSVAAGSCHAPSSMGVVAKACVGQSHCCLPVIGHNFGRDPCFGKDKRLAVVVRGCVPLRGPSRFRRYCSLLGGKQLCDEDIDYLAALELPEASAPLLPVVAVMVDTSWRPELQRFVVDNVHNNTGGWHIQIFTGPTNRPKLADLFSDYAARNAITLTQLSSDYMEDWERLSSLMLIDVFWKAVVGEKVLIFQPDSIMCAAAGTRIDAFLKYDFVGAPMAGAWWPTTDDASQWTVGNGGFSLRDRAKSIRMCNEPECVTPAAGKLEDQQLGASWKFIEERCGAAGITVSKPTRHEAVKFGVEYDIYMDILPGEDPALPQGCRAGWYTGPLLAPNGRAKWNPKPTPADVPCEKPFFVPLGCHKCWFWNHRTWDRMSKSCPEAAEMRARRAMYSVGAEFNGFPARPKPRAIRGAALPDKRFPPADIVQGTCRGNCQMKEPPHFEKTVLGKYHK